jgi:hypothetical protein
MGDDGTGSMEPAVVNFSVTDTSRAGADLLGWTGTTRDDRASCVAPAAGVPSTIQPASTRAGTVGPAAVRVTGLARSVQPVGVGPMGPIADGNGTRSLRAPSVGSAAARVTGTARSAHPVGVSTTGPNADGIGTRSLGSSVPRTRQGFLHHGSAGGMRQDPIVIGGSDPTGRGVSGTRDVATCGSRRCEASVRCAH